MLLRINGSPLPLTARGLPACSLDFLVRYKSSCFSSGAFFFFFCIKTKEMKNKAALAASKL
jgi:hypothetical protein